MRIKNFAWVLALAMLAMAIPAARVHVHTPSTGATLADFPGPDPQGGPGGVV